METVSQEIKNAREYLRGAWYAVAATGSLVGISAIAAFNNEPEAAFTSGLAATVMSLYIGTHVGVRIGNLEVESPKP